MEPNIHSDPVVQKSPKKKIAILIIITMFVLAVTASFIVWSGATRNSITDVSPTISPDAPAVSYINSQEALLSWNKVDGAFAYNLQCSGDVSFSKPESIVVQANSPLLASCTLLETGKEYYARLKATTVDGDTRWSAITIMKIAILLSTPENFKVVTVSSSEVSYSWDDVKGAKVYEVQRSTDRNFIENVIVTTHTTNSGNDELLVPGSTYYFRVRAQNTDNTISIVPYSLFVSIQTPAS